MKYFNKTLLKYGVPFLLGGMLFLVTYYLTKKDSDPAHQVYSILKHYGLTYDIDACSIESTFDKSPRAITGSDEFLAHIAHFTARKKKLQLLLVAFPFKSANHERKTVSALPDMAERRSLEYLQTALYDIRNVYAPGAHLTIFCDGIPFASLFNITYREVIRYETHLQALAADLPDITLYTSSDFIKEHRLNHVEDIIPFLNTVGAKKNIPPPPLKETVRKRLAHEFDYPAGKAFLLHRSLDLASLAAQFSQRETALRNYIASAFPSSEYLRLSAHFSPDISKKFGIKLSPDSCVLPYHGVLVEKLDGSWELRFKHDVCQKETILVTKKVNGIDCTYFKQTTERKNHVKSY